MDAQEKILLARAEGQLGTTLVGKYRLDRVLGVGGMATVFAATHRNQAELAVKILHPELGLRDDLKKRFLREGYVANSVKHAGAVMVVDDAIAEDGSAFLVMELLRGATVDRLWEESGCRLSSRAVTAMALQLLDVLAAAHEKAIVHRDLKPANLFVTTDGTLKVLDFGIARLRDPFGTGEHATRTGSIMGTPAFMAPEQAQAAADEIDGRSDIWAVGATMFTLLTGELVHNGANSSQLLIQAATARARAVASIVSDVEPGIANVVDRALTFEKAGRWPSAAAMYEALLLAATESFGEPPRRDSLAQLLLPAPHVSLRFTAATQPPGGSSRPTLDEQSIEARGSASTMASPEGAPSVPGARKPTLASSGRTAAPSSRVGSRPSGGAVAIVSIIVAAAAVLFALSRSRTRSSESIVQGAPASATPTDPASPTVPAPARAAAASASAAAPAALPAFPALPDVPTLSTPAAPPESTAVPEPPKPKHNAVRAIAPRKPDPPPVHDCAATPFWYDENGDKHWYRECQQ